VQRRGGGWMKATNGAEMHALSSSLVFFNFFLYYFLVLKLYSWLFVWLFLLRTLYTLTIGFTVLRHQHHKSICIVSLLLSILLLHNTHLDLPFFIPEVFLTVTQRLCQTRTCRFISLHLHFISPWHIASVDVDM